MLILSNPYSTLTITGTFLAMMVHFTFGLLLLQMCVTYLFMNTVALHGAPTRCVALF